jgi:hypothetical protein
MTMPTPDLERSITRLDDFIGKKIQMIAYGTSYLGTLQKVDYEEGYVILTDGRDTVTIDLERVESYQLIK